MSVAGLRRGALRHIGWVLGLAVIAIMVGAVLRIGDLHAFATMLENARPGWLLVALGLQATTYASVAAGWKIVLARTDTPQPLRRLYAIAVGKLFADQVITVAGMGGNLFLVDRLTALGVKRGNAVATLLVARIGFYAVYGVCALAMLTMLWIKGLASIWIAGFVLVFHRHARPDPARPRRVRGGRDGILALMGVPVEAALATTLMLRVFTLWLPLAPGFVLIRTALRTEAVSIRKRA